MKQPTNEGQRLFLEAAAAALDRAALMAEGQRLFELVVERLGEYTGEWWTVAIEGGEVAVVLR